MLKFRNLRISTFKSFLNLTRYCTKGKGKGTDKEITTEKTKGQQDEIDKLTENVNEKEFKSDNTDYISKQETESKKDELDPPVTTKTFSMHPNGSDTTYTVLPLNYEARVLFTTMQMFDELIKMSTKTVDKGADPKKPKALPKTGCSGDTSNITSKSCTSLNARKICGSDDKGSKKKTIKKQKVTLIPAEGIGPEICTAMQQVLEAVEAPIEWEQINDPITKTKKGKAQLSPELLKSLMTNKIGIRGPVSPGPDQLYHCLRKEFGLYGFVAVCRNMEGLETRYDPLDCVIIRDQTEGEYSGIEHEVVPGVIQSIKVGTEVAAKRLAEYVFKFACLNKRKRITVAHKANIMRLTDGIYLKSMRTVAEKFSEQFQFEERYLDTVCCRLIRSANINDIIVSSSMYGEVLTVMAAALIGGLTICPCFSVGKHGVMYETAHNRGMEIVGKDLANPTSIMRSAAIMLRDMNYTEIGDKVECAISAAFKEGIRTKDLGGKCKCSEFTNAVCELIKEI